MKDLAEHLQLYGIRHHESPDSYFSWAGEQLGEEKASKLDRLRRPFQSGRPNRRDSLRLHTFVARNRLWGLVSSIKASAILASGNAVVVALGQAPPKRNRRVLDLGCNVGYLTTWFALRFPQTEVIGLDFIDGYIKEAQGQADALGCTNATFVAGDISRVADLGSFDFVIDCQALGLGASLPHNLKDIHSSLLDDGTLISIPPIGRVAEMRRFISALNKTGFYPRAIDFQRFSDCGDPGGFPMLTIQKTASDYVPDLDKLYGDVMADIELFRDL